MYSKKKGLFPGQPISTSPSAPVNTVASGCLLKCWETAWPSQRKETTGCSWQAARGPTQGWNGSLLQFSSASPAAGCLDGQSRTQAVSGSKDRYWSLNVKFLLPLTQFCSIPEAELYPTSRAGVKCDPISSRPLMCDASNSPVHVWILCRSLRTPWFSQSTALGVSSRCQRKWEIKAQNAWFWVFMS